MRTNRVTPKGIIRITGEHDTGDGACDEVINLRYEQGSMRLCGKKGLLATSSTIFLAFYRHRLPGRDNYIGIYVKNGRLKVSTVTIDNGIASPDAERVSNPAPAIAVFDEGDTIDVKFINNLLIISSENEHKIYTYYYRDNAYSLLSDGTLPSIQLGFSKTDYYGSAMTEKDNQDRYVDDAEVADYTLEGVAERFYENDNLSMQNVIDEISAGISFIRRSKDKHKTEGWVAVCANFTLFDNSQTKPSPPIWFYLGAEPSLRFGCYDPQWGSWGQGHLHISMPTSSLSVYISSIVGHDFAKYKDLIKSINIYSTYPHSGFDIEKTFRNGLILPLVKDWAKKWKKQHDTNTCVRVFRKYICTTNAYVKNTVTDAFSYESTDPSDLDGELFRLQKTIPYQQSLDAMSNIIVELDFSETALAGALMPVENSGYVSRYGKMTTYNSRLHLFDITNRLSLPTDGGNPDGPFGQSWMHKPDLLDLDSSVSGSFLKNLEAWTDDDFSVEVALCEISTRKEGKTLTSYRTIKVPYFTREGERLVVIRARATVTDADSYNVRLFTNNGYASFALQPSVSYNHADVHADGYTLVPLERFFIGAFRQPSDRIPQNSGPLASPFYSEGREYVCVSLSQTSEDWHSFGDDVVEYGEDDTVVVSAQNNPTYFSPENSYRIGGKVLAVSPNAEAVSDVQVGQYPLAVFTDNGIYTLIQGDGKVLYSNVAKIAEDIMKEGSSVLPTTYGITFLSGDGVFTLVGRKCVRISLALDGPPDWDIRQCAQYQAAHECTDTHMYAWKNGTDFVYTDSATPSAGSIAYDKYGEALPLRISGAGGTGIEYDGNEYTYSQDDNRNLLYNVQPYLSDDFRDEIADVSKVRLLFDAYKAELILSITDRPYSYVYSFTERQWHKITETFAFGSEALALVYPPVATGASPTCEIRNVNDETFGINEPVMVHLQTRCVKFGTESYKAVHRLLGRVNVNNTHDYNIPNGDITGMYLYASRDLRHWSMVGLYQHKGYTDLMHVNKTAAHFKYFLITFGGKLIKDSEITGFDADVLYRYQDKER